MDASLVSLLLTPDEMTAADAASARSGIPSFDLMDRAGRAISAAALRHFPGALRFVALCGPGNNGGTDMSRPARLPKPARPLTSIISVIPEH